MSWLKLIVRIDAGGPGGLDAVLEEAGAAAVTTVGDSTRPVFELAPGQALTWDRCELHALFDAHVDVGTVVSALLAAADERAAPSFDVEFVRGDHWEDQWRQHAARACFGKRLWLMPRDEPVAADGLPVLRLDPGMAFGTGTHPTTHLCLDWLAGQALDGRSVLDFGTGSGVLAIAAALLGAAPVTAVDHDPQALVATRDNATYNGVFEHLLIGDIELLTSDFQVDVVVANVLANPLIDLAPRLSDCLGRGGAIALSGLLEDQAESVRAAYPAFDLASVTRDGWALLAGRRR